jgi:hypothetical protein
MPYRMDEIYAALREADLFVSIGTSGAVYPAAGFVRTRANWARGRWSSISNLPGLALVPRIAAWPGDRSGAGLGGGDASRALNSPGIPGPWRSALS